MDFINRIAAEAALRQAQEIERQLVDHNVVAIPIVGGQHAVYRVPCWRERPIRRLRIEWYRFKRRCVVRPTNHL